MAGDSTKLHDKVTKQKWMLYSWPKLWSVQKSTLKIKHCFNINNNSETKLNSKGSAKPQFISSNFMKHSLLKMELICVTLDDLFLKL